MVLEYFKKKKCKYKLKRMEEDREVCTKERKEFT